MPIFHLHCKSCDLDDRRVVMDPADAPKQTCKECSGLMERVFGAPSVVVKESLDNGAMIKVVERLSDAPRLFSERAEAHRREMKGEE